MDWSVNIVETIKYYVRIMPDIIGVYGFGSFFRSKTAHDIDLVILVRPTTKSLQSLHREIHLLFMRIAQKIQFPIDVLILTNEELKNAPLDEKNNLITLYQNPDL